MQVKNSSEQRIEPYYSSVPRVYLPYLCIISFVGGL